MTKKWKKIWFDVAILTILSLCVYPFRFMAFSPMDFANIHNDSNEELTSELYYTVHAASAEQDTCISISLIDVGDITGPSSHEQFSILFEKILSYHPRKIGIDVIFNKALDSIYSDPLIHAVRKIKDKSVFTMDLKDYNENGDYSSSKNSFFKDSVRIIEGYSNLRNARDKKSVLLFQPMSSLKGKQVASFPMMLASDILKPSQLEANEYLIDYRPTYFPRMNSQTLDSTLITDRYVLIGGIYDNNDLYNTPLGIMSGVEIHAYTLNTLLNGRMKDTSTKWGDYILGFLVCIAFCLLLVWLDCKLASTKSEMMMFLGQQSLISLGATYLVIWLLGLVGYLSFMVSDVFLSMGPAIAFLLKVITIAKIVYAFIIFMLTKKFKTSIAKYSTYANNK